MVKVDYDVLIRRAPEDVFAYVTQVEQIPEWQREGGVKKVTKSAEGPLAVGSRFRMDRESRGRMATTQAYRHFGYTPPSQPEPPQQTLF